MLIIPKNQALERWDTLPESLREALYSESNADLLEQACRDEHISEENISTISQIIGYVLLGFLHPEDISREIAERLNIDPRIAKSLQDRIVSRIFAPIKTDIDTIYKPLAKSEILAPVKSPSVIQDIGPMKIATGAKPLSTPPPQAPKPVSLSGTNLSLHSTPLPANTMTPPPLPKKAQINPLSQAGWSKTQADAPVVRLDITQPTSSIPKPPTPPAPPKSSMPTPVRPVSRAANGAVGEFERLGMAPAPMAATEPLSKPAPMPVILHQDELAKPLEETNNFHLSRPNSEPEIDLSAIAPKPSGPKAAVIEVGKITSNNQKPGASAAVHYTSLAASLSSQPTANTGPRKIEEVTSVPRAPSIPPAPQKFGATPPNPFTPIPTSPSIPKPIVPPIPPTPFPSSLSSIPKPPIPPVPKTPPPQPSAPQDSDQKGKVIVKDFLEPNK